MKTKLLKKVRKRFEIFEVRNHGKNDLQYIDTKDLSYPFYVIVDNKSPLYFLGAIQTYKGAQTELIRIVLLTYKDKATRRLMTTKVYYNKKEKS